MSITKQKIVQFDDEGWPVMQEGIAKLKEILEGVPGQFTSEEYMTLYTYPFFCFSFIILLLYSLLI